MSRDCECPKCGADISDTYEPDDPSVGIYAGWYCDSCDLGVGDDDGYEPMEGDVGVIPSSPRPDGKIGTALSELSGQPGHHGYAEFCRIARSWGYD